MRGRDALPPRHSSEAKTSRMNHEYFPQTPDALRRHASKLQAMAAFVCRQDVAWHLKEQAAAVLAEAELRAIAARE